VIASFLSADGLLALTTLRAMEIVLGVDNVVFIAILTGRLPARQQLKRAGSGSCSPSASASCCCWPSPG
jgi:predicted tellurium resistance membrane protein TerC